MRTYLIIFLLLPVLRTAGQGQTDSLVRAYKDSLDRAFKLAKTDPERSDVLRQLGYYYLERNPVKAISYWDQGIAIAKKNDKVIDEAYDLAFKAYVLIQQGKYPESFQCLQEALIQAQDETNESKTWNIEKNPNLHVNRLIVLVQVHHNMGLLMAATNNIDQEIVQYKEAKVLCEQSGYGLGLVNMNLAGAYLSIRKYDLAVHLFKDAEINMRQTNFLTYMGSVYMGLGDIYRKQGHNQLALQYFYKAVGAAQQEYNFTDVSRGYRYLADYFLKLGQADSSLNYAVKTLKALRSMGSKDLGDAFENLYKSYQLKHYTDSAYKYQGLALAAKDSSYKSTIQSLADFQKLSFQAQLHAQELEKENAAIQTKIRTYTLLAGIVVFMLLAAIFYRNNRQKQKANIILNQQKEEVQSALSQLKATQTQLIQSEKMASLGELTAGIAHEIQNPLNFVNNFSEVNTELIGEMKEEIEKGDLEEIKAIASDIEENSKKINQHGKRADAIVKGMLQHSQSGTGTKEPTDINALADECMRLAYHTLTAKDKSFNAIPIAIGMVTRFDETLPLVNVIPQDMVRVMLNLFNNAFYAVNQKAKAACADYKPIVEVETFFLPLQGVGGLKVRDNGIGIPDSIKDKIMQPFFTTKPTGEGTGLGLSLTYDMVVKGHGGSIQLNSTEGEGSEFTISLPA